METIKIQNLTEEEFYDKFKCEKNHIDTDASFNGYLFETYGEELDYVFKMSKENRAITIIELDKEREEVFINDMGVEITETVPNMCYASGFHSVNRIGFFVLAKPYKYEFEVKIE